jgi:hypothetical protein
MRTSRRSELRNLILVCGFDQSGKSTAANYLSEIGYQKFECGEYVRSILETQRGVVLTEMYQNNMRLLNSQILRALSAAVRQDCPRLKIAVVGIRSIELFMSIKNMSQCSVKSVFVESDFDERYARHCSDVRIGHHLTIEEFRNNDDVQVGWGLARIKELCDFRVFNRFCKDDYKQKLLSVLEV